MWKSMASELKGCTIWGSSVTGKNWICVQSATLHRQADLAVTYSLWEGTFRNYSNQIIFQTPGKFWPGSIIIKSITHEARKLPAPDSTVALVPSFISWRRSISCYIDCPLVISRNIPERVCDVMTSMLKIQTSTTSKCRVEPSTWQSKESR